MGRLALDVDTWIDAGRLVVEVSGEVDCYSVPLLREALAGGGATRPLRIAVVCERLEFIDSSGIGALVGGLKRAQASGGRLALVGCSPHVDRMLHRLALHRVFGLHGGLEDAFAWLDLARA